LNGTAGHPRGHGWGQRSPICDRSARFAARGASGRCTPDQRPQSPALAREDGPLRYPAQSPNPADPCNKVALCVGDVRQFWGYKSPVQPDGGEVLAKRKGGTARGLPLRGGPAQAVATLPALPFGHPPVVRAFLRTARPNSADGRVRIVCKRLSRQRWGPAPQRQGQRFRGHCFVPGSESTAGFPPGRVSRARAPPFRIGFANGGGTASTARHFAAPL